MTATSSPKNAKAFALKDVSFQTKIGLGFASVLLVMVALGAAMFFKLSTAKEGAAWTTHIYKVIGQLVAQTGGALEDIVRRVAQVTTRISEISTGSKEQSAGLNEVIVGIGALG